LINQFNKINKFYFNFKIKANLPEIIHYTYFDKNVLYPSKSKKVITELDLIKEKLYYKDFKLQIDLKKKIFNQVDHIVCISENTKRDLMNFYDINEDKN
jgi:Zn-dependent metalloprotease